MRNAVILSFAVFTLSACGGSSSDKLDLQSNGNIHDAIESATGPLQDMNIRRTEIPPLLVKAQQDPYGHLSPVKCDAIKTEVAQLDDLLGPDVQPGSATFASTDRDLGDSLENLPNAELPDQDSVVDTAGSIAHDAVMGLIHTQTNIIPFRSIIRKLTGADSHQKKLEAAYQAGKLRRAFLKGLAEDHFGPKCLAKPIMVEAAPVAIVAKADEAPVVH